MVLHRHIKLESIVFLIVAVFFGPVYAKSNANRYSTQTLRSMSRAYMAFGNHEKAHELAEHALNQARSEHVKEGEIALCLIDMGTVCGYQGLLDEAAERFEEGVQLQKKALFGEHPYVAHTLRMLSDIYRRQERMELAEDTLSQAMYIMLKQCSLNSREMGPFILESARIQLKKGQTDDALANYQAVLDMYEQNYGSRHLMTATVLEEMAHLYIAQQDIDRADQFMSESLAIKKRIYGRYHTELIDSWLTMARICKIQGKMERCEYYLTKSTETASQTHNVITMAQVYEQANQIRTEGLVASAVSLN